MVAAIHSQLLVWRLIVAPSSDPLECLVVTPFAKMEQRLRHSNADCRVVVLDFVWRDSVEFSAGHDLRELHHSTGTTKIRNMVGHVSTCHVALLLDCNRSDP